jgi:hypothetical protein
METQETDLVKANLISRCLAVSMIMGAFVAQSTPVFAADLPFSADCSNHTAINVASPDTGITFRKNPNSTATRAATATVSTTNGLAITIPVNVVSCFYTVQGNNSYCFQASSDSAAFMNINAVANTNTAAAPACQ